MSRHYFLHLVLPSQFCKYPPTSISLFLVLMPMLGLSWEYEMLYQALEGYSVIYCVLLKTLQSSCANVSLAFLVTGNLQCHFQGLGPHCTCVHLLMVSIWSLADGGLWGKQSSSGRRQGRVFAWAETVIGPLFWVYEEGS